MATNTARIAALESTVAGLAEGQNRMTALLEQALAQFNPAAPAMTEPVTQEVVEGKPCGKCDRCKNSGPKGAGWSDCGQNFVAWLAESREARAERKATNKELAQACRKVGVNPAGTAWAYAKAQTEAGKAINVRTLKAKGAADKKAAKKA